MEVKMKYQKLFETFVIKGVKIPNRIAMAPMGVEMAHPNGKISQATIDYYRERAKGGVGLILTEYTRINEADAVTAPRQLSLGKDSHIKGMKELVDAVHEEGSKIFVQLNHPGRQNVIAFPGLWPTSRIISKFVPGYWNMLFKILGKSSPDTLLDPKAMKKYNKIMKPLLAPSVVKAGLGESKFSLEGLKEMDLKDIERIENEFSLAAYRAKKAGADGVELHAGHGYLLCQFLSPYTNRRKDEYGGSSENRVRIIAEIIWKIRHLCGNDFPIGIRYSVSELYESLGYANMGIDKDEGVRIGMLLENAGADFLDLTMGNSDTQFAINEPISFPIGWRSDYIKAVKEKVSIPVVAVNLIRTPEQGERMLEEGLMDIVSLGRPLLADPYWAKKAKEGREKRITRCINCLSCMEGNERDMSKGLPVHCALNPELGRGAHRISKNSSAKSALIIGGGPAGLFMALKLREKGYRCRILEKEDKLGGQVNLAKMPPHKERIHHAVEDLEYKCRLAGVEISLGVEADKEMILGEHPDVVVLATGAKPLIPRIPGVDKENVFTIDDVLSGKIELNGEEIALIGSGMSGLECAEFLLEKGNKVKIFDMAEKPCPGGYHINVNDSLRRLEKFGANFYLGRKLLEIGEDYVETSDKNGVYERFSMSKVVLSLGSRKQNALSSELSKEGLKVVEIGDCKKIGRISDAILSAYEAAALL